MRLRPVRLYLNNTLFTPYANDGLVISKACQHAKNKNKSRGRSDKNLYHFVCAVAGGFGNGICDVTVL